MIKIRVDDFPQTKGEPQHTLAAYREFDRCLSECIGGKRYLLGVIPGRCSIDDLLFIRNETSCVVGMHGTDHDEAKLDRNGGSQFETFLTAAQISKVLFEIRSALQDAVGRAVKIYMPPRNVIDPKVISAAIAAGFEKFTSGPETSRQIRVDWKDYLIHSEPPDQYGRTDELFQRRSYERLINSQDNGEDIILALHWTWETNIGLDHMRKFFNEIPKNVFGDFDD